ncbi:uncharacterized protein LOC120273192 [Dioscorea cayenensis subsp. rotundata]|uniref:Uncharacterized protein LOC120273192 n=1 Tax=Dioscorea cayennensis subsp. rotundata TaxID=55577 RepID=A0AB40C9H2_DIOCR|nr:uncharacterized protein LOC120273192 [Dioscorea cayenensis subsp. rotundata]
MSDFEALRMNEVDSIDDFAGKISGVANKLSELGASVKDGTLVKKLFNSVPSKYLQVLASLEQLFDVDEMPFEEAIGRLKAYEKRVKKDDKQGNQLLLTREKWSARTKRVSGEPQRHGATSSEGRGWGKTRGRGRGRHSGGRGGATLSRLDGASGSRDKQHI